jgi:homoserine dehydrogenase
MKPEPVRKVRLLLIGAGNVGRRFLDLLVRKDGTLRDRLGLELIVVGVADRSGAATSAEGLVPEQIMALKRAGQGVAGYPTWGRPGLLALEMVRSTDADLLLEASPANMKDGQPGLACIETALAKGMNVVTANKAPLVIAFPRLLALAEKHEVSLRFDATVAGGLPAVNLGQRDLAAADILRLEGVLNLTSNYILTRMAGDNLSYEQALHEAQAAGHAETDPTLDVDGWDAANKLVILAHSVLRYPATLQDVSVEGIRGVTSEMLAKAVAESKRIKLVATAEKGTDGYRLTVRPTRLDDSYLLAQLGPKQMGIVYYTDISGVISAAIVEETPMPTASAMLRDVVELYSG